MKSRLGKAPTTWAIDMKDPEEMSTLGVFIDLLVATMTTRRGAAAYCLPGGEGGGG